MLFLWLLALVLLEETKCAVPLDIVTERVSATLQPPRWILKITSAVEPLISHHRRARYQKQKNPLKTQIVYFLNKYNELYPTSEEKPRQIALLKYQEPNAERFGELRHTNKRDQRLSSASIENSVSKETYKPINRKFVKKSRDIKIPKHYLQNAKHKKLKTTSQSRPKLTQYDHLYNHLLLAILRSVLHRRHVGNDFTQINNKRSNSKYENKIYNKREKFGDVLNIFEDLQDKTEETNDGSIDYGYEKMTSVFKRKDDEKNIIDASLDLEAIPIKHQDKSVGQRIPRSKKRQKREAADPEWRYPGNGPYSSNPRRQNSLVYRFVSGEFQNDDYQPFLWAKDNPYPPKTLEHGNTIFLAQAVPLLKSMIFGKGIEQGPDVAPFRVHWTDLHHYENKKHYSGRTGPPIFKEAQNLPTDEVLAKKYNLETVTGNYDAIPEPLASYRKNIIAQ